MRKEISALLLCAITMATSMTTWVQPALAQTQPPPSQPEANKPPPTSQRAISLAQQTAPQGDLGRQADVLALQPGSLATGRGFSCALSIANGVRCWGYNGGGALGSGNVNARSLTPVDVIGLTTNVKKVIAGSVHACALTTSGGVKCWGSNEYFQLGNGSSAGFSFTPVNVISMTSGVLDISSSLDHTCAVTSVGAVQCWGDNFYGQLGNGNKTSSNVPVQVTGLVTGTTAVGVGFGHSCALMIDKTVKCWGNNFAGQIGGSPIGTDSLSPVSVPSLSDVAQLTGGGYHNCALTTSGSVKCWGYNAYGQLGDGSTNSVAEPVQVSGLTSGVGALALGEFHSCAVLSDSSVKCWGQNFYGQVGDGGITDQLTPIAVAGLAKDISWIATGETHSCALSQAGKIKCWGNNSRGQLGDGTVRIVSTPASATGLSSGATSISAGTFHACAVVNGGVKCWGHNSNGQLGDGTRTPSSVPVAVTGLGSGVAAVIAGGYHSCAILTSGVAKCWGANSQGQLGDGSNNDRLTPVDVSGLSNAGQLSLGLEFSCAVTTAGEVKCWGNNGQGQLGDGTTNAHNTPNLVSGLTSGAQRVAAGAFHACAVVGGAAKCWGLNNVSQLGDGSTTRKLTPVNVSGLGSGVADVGTGENHSCALTTGGGVKCWGYNYYSQLGNGGGAGQLVPVDVTGFNSGVQTLAVGRNHACLITDQGKLNCWGANLTGELGIGETPLTESTPVSVTALANATAVDAGDEFTCAISNGGVQCFGNNNEGEVGNGVPLIFGVVSVFGIFLPTTVSAINYTAITTLNTARTIDVTKNYGAAGQLVSNTQGQHGTVGCSSAGTCVYTPTLGYIGPDDFSYVLKFGSTSSARLAPDATNGYVVTGTVSLLVATTFVFLPTLLR